MDRLLTQAYAPTTHLTYAQGIAAFNDFCRATHQVNSFPVTPEIVPHFVAYLSLSGKSFSTAKTYLAAISAKHKINNMPDPTNSFLVKKLMQGFSRSVPSKDARFPITFERLKQLVACLHLVCSNSYESTLFKTAFTLSFFGFFRVSELIGQGQSLSRGRTGIQKTDVRISNDKVVVKLRGSKTDQNGKGQSVSLPQVVESPDTCPVRVLLEYLQHRPKSGGLLLIHINSHPLSRYQFQAVLKKAAQFLGWPAQGYSSHSFRIGAATTAAMNGMSISSIMHKGRWKSAAVKGYLRPERV